MEGISYSDYMKIRGVASNTPVGLSMGERASAPTTGSLGKTTAETERAMKKRSKEVKAPKKKGKAKRG